MTKKEFINKHGWSDCDNAIMKSDLNLVLTSELEKFAESLNILFDPKTAVLRYLKKDY